MKTTVNYQPSATNNDIEFEINVSKLKSTLEKIPDRINFLKIIQ